MTGAHYHLIVNHIPIFSVAFGVGTLSWGMIKRNTAIKKLAAILFLIGSVSSYIAIETGESAEEIVEEIPTVTHHLIHEHEEVAETSFWLTIGLGILSLLWLFADNLNVTFKKPLLIIILLLGIGTFGTLAYTAYLGGEIRHTEIRQNPSAQPANMEENSDSHTESE